MCFLVVWKHGSNKFEMFYENGAMYHFNVVHVPL